MKHPETPKQKLSNRRSFLRNGMMVAGAARVGAGMLSKGIRSAFAQDPGGNGLPLNEGDIAILRFLAAAEIIESDLWIQYAELGGIGDNPRLK